MLVKGMKPPCRRKSFPSKRIMDIILNPHIKNLVRKMLLRDPEKRYTIDIVIEKLQD